MFYEINIFKVYRLSAGTADLNIFSSSIFVQDFICWCDFLPQLQEQLAEMNTHFPIFTQNAVCFGNNGPKQPQTHFEKIINVFELFLT